jgi:hypothetical protein
MDNHEERASALEVIAGVGTLAAVAGTVLAVTCL